MKQRNVEGPVTPLTYDKREPLAKGNDGQKRPTGTKTVTEVRAENTDDDR